MKGEVIHVHVNKGMVAVEDENGDYSIIELIRDELEVGDQLQWGGSHPLGRAVVTNLTGGRALDVYFQNHGVSRGQISQQLLY